MLSMAPSGDCFAGGGGDGQFYFFKTAEFRNAPGPASTYHIPEGHGAVYGVAVAEDGSSYAGTMNVVDAGAVYLVNPTSAVGTLIKKFDTAKNPNCVTINSGAGLMAVADGHPDGHKGNFYLYENIDTTPQQKWGFETPNMSWPIAISGNGKTVVGGCDYPGNVYYFSA